MESNFNFLEPLIIFIFFLTHGLKIILNWKVYNKLHPTRKVKPRPNYTGMWLKESYSGIREIDDSNFMFLYCAVIFFWIKIPIDRNGKIMAWSVLVLSIVQIITLWFAPWKTD